MSLLSGYIYNVVARRGLAAQVPVLLVGEIGYDTDTRTLRVGDLTPQPPRIPTTKATGVFDFSSMSKWTLPGGVEVESGKVDGVDISTLNLANGLLARRGNGVFGESAITSGNNSILVTNGDGSQDLIDIRINPSALTNILGPDSVSNDMLMDGSVTVEKINLRVDSYKQNTPPAHVPGTKTRHVVGTVPTGAWAGKANNIAISNGETWKFVAPYEGMLVMSATDDSWYYFISGTGWVALVSGGGGGGGGDFTGLVGDRGDVVVSGSGLVWTLETVATAGTYGYPSSVTIDAKGRVTSITGRTGQATGFLYYATVYSDGALAASYGPLISNTDYRGQTVATVFPSYPYTDVFPNKTYPSVVTDSNGAVLYRVIEFTRGGNRPSNDGPVG